MNELKKPFHLTRDGNMYFDGIPQDNGEKFIKQLRKQYPELGIPSKLLAKKGNRSTTDTGLEVIIYKQNHTRWIMELKDPNNSNAALINEICEKSVEFYKKVREELEIKNKDEFNKIPSDLLDIMKAMSRGSLTAADYMYHNRKECHMRWTYEQLPSMVKDLEAHGYKTKPDGITVNLIIYNPKNNSTYRFATHTWDNQFWLTNIS